MVNYKEIVAASIELHNRTGHVMRDLNSGFEVGPAKGDDLLRVQKSSLLQGSVMDCNIFMPKEEVYGNIPEYDPSKMYIVSQKVAEVISADPKFAGRTDFVYPINIEHEHVKKELLDAYGQIVTDSKGEPMTVKQQKLKGCRGFEFPRSRNHD